MPHSQKSSILAIACNAGNPHVGLMSDQVFRLGSIWCSGRHVVIRATASLLIVQLSTYDLTAGSKQ